MLDYVMIPDRWKNSVKDVETEPRANIASDHYPMVATLKIKLTAEQGKLNKPAVKYEKANEEETRGL